MEKTLFPGTRVKVFDSSIYINDVQTPISLTMKSATVLCWYGKENIFGRYSSLVDVLFDDDSKVSHGHFTDVIEMI